MTLRFLSSHVYWLLLIIPLFLLSCGEYEYVRSAYPVKKAAYKVQPPTSLPAANKPGPVPLNILPAIPLPPAQIWLSPGCLIDATALDDSPCTRQIIADVLQLQYSPTSEIRECFNEDLKMHIRFEIDSSLLAYGTPSKCILKRERDSGVQQTDSTTLHIRIILNPYHLARSTRLSIAGSIIHEMLHAYFFYRCVDAAGDPVKEQHLAIDLPFLKPFYLYKQRYVQGNHHEQMAQNYIDKMAAALKEYQLITEESLQPMQLYSRRLGVDDYYKALAWGGLASSVNGDITSAWTAFKASHAKTAQAYEIIMSAEHNCTVLSASKNRCSD